MKTSYIRILLASVIFLRLSLPMYGQSSVSIRNYNPIHTAVPSLTIAPDARATGMGDVGVATLPDVYSQHWNPAKYPFVSGYSGVAFGYTPWLRDLVDNIYLANITGYYKPQKSDKHSFSASIKYFHIGDINIPDATSSVVSTVSPYEMSVDVAYARKLSNAFALSVALRYIRSDYSYAGASDTYPLQAANALAADIAGYGQTHLMLGGSRSLVGFGFNISNLGGKISNNGGNTYAYLPTNLRLGASITYPIDENNKLGFSVDANKLLVPTPPVQGASESLSDYEQRVYDYSHKTSALSGIFKSFSDAPGGFKEEWQEIMWSIGLEYLFQERFAVRTGYFHEDTYKGNRQYLTFGAGFRYEAFQLDASYLAATSQANPLDQTLRFSLGIRLDALKDMFQ